MEKNKKTRMIVGIFAIIAVLAVAGYGGFRLYRHEKEQNQRIADLQGQLEALIARQESRKEIGWKDTEYNYLAIGNSITKHDLTDYWWNEIGMAASDADHDYYHLVLKHLQTAGEPVHGEIYSFIPWEVQSQDRNETLTMLDPYLSPEIDLITIQLGENALDTTTFAQDFESLIRYIQIRAGKVRILVIGDFWSQGNRDELKQSIAERTGAEYISLEGLRDNPEYYCGTGITVYDADGNPHTVEHQGVASHPGDRGMSEIADGIIQKIEKDTKDN